MTKKWLEKKKRKQHEKWMKKQRSEPVQPESREYTPKRDGEPDSRYDVKMPFGKYEGCWVSSLPIGYLIWVAEHIDINEHKEVVHAANTYRGEHLLHPRRWKSHPSRLPGSFGSGKKW